MFIRPHSILSVAIALAWSTSIYASATFVFNFEDPLQPTDGRTAVVKFNPTLPDGSPAGITLHKTEDYFHFVDLSGFSGTSAFGQRTLQAAHQPEDQGPGNNPFELRFDNRTANHLSVDFGDFGGDADQLFLKAWDKDENTIALVTDVLPGGGTEFRSKTLEVNVPGIKYAFFFGGPVGNNSMLFDNISYTVEDATPPAAIPLPSPLLASLPVLALLGLAMHRRQKKLA